MLKRLQKLYPNLCELVVLEKGDVLILNNSSSNLYFVMYGIIQVGKVNVPQRVITLVLLTTKQCFITSTVSSREYQIKSLNRSSILIIKTKDIVYLLKKIPIFFPLIIYGLYSYTLLVEDFASIFIPRTTTKRTIALLLFLTKHFSVNNANKVEVSINLSQANIAQLIGSTRVSVNKVFQFLQKVKCLEIFAGKIIIKNPVFLAFLSGKNKNSQLY
uniref:global nitrogen transcriptional regulator n=1 Tax=Rhodospora sordida TaxID=362230 RepID=UPI001FCD5948|nr:global nitrogen transcriptional regulator [Rhodospora sordida]UNJ15087.1 global nitrogen transcriptional regulator [Rhodospora sordida]